MGNTVYFATSEFIGFTGGTGNYINGTDLNYARGNVPTNGDTAGYASLPIATPDNTTDGYWVHFRKYQDVGQFYWRQPFDIYTPGGAVSFRFYQPSQDSLVKAVLYSNTGATVESGLTDQLYGQNGGVVGVAITVDIHVFTNANGHAEAHVFKNGHRIITLTNTNGYHRGCSYVRLANICKSRWAFYSEVIVADFDTRRLRVNSYYPSAAGYYTDGVGNYTAIDESYPDGAVVQFNTTGEKQSYKVAKHGSPAAGSIVGIAVASRARTADDSIDLQMGLRLDDQDYFATPFAVSGALGNFNRVWSAHPGGGALPQDLTTNFEIVHQVITR